jgi:hypothetical protein
MKETLKNWVLYITIGVLLVWIGVMIFMVTLIMAQFTSTGVASWKPIVALLIAVVEFLRNLALLNEF